MADAFEGSLNVRATSQSQHNKVRSLNTADFKLKESIEGRMFVDLAGLSGTETLTEAGSRRQSINFINTKGGGTTIEIDNDIKQSYWLRDFTDDAARVDLKPVGGTGTLTLADHPRWLLARMR
ncbi:hypothetical protein LCGC14_2212590, partial [marine sediment metagenome]